MALPDCTDGYGQTALHRAARNYLSNGVYFLLDHAKMSENPEWLKAGANPSVTLTREYSGISVLTMAVLIGNEDVVKHLQGAGAR